MIKDIISKHFNIGRTEIKPESLSSSQHLAVIIFLALTVIIKILVIPYNMMTMGDSATRVWNALWWAQDPFFVMPVSGHPFWFYFMGSLIKVTGEFFYTSIVTMISLMTVAGYFIFRLSMLFANFRASLFALLIYLINPVIFRLNFEPYSQQPYLALICISLYYITKALLGTKSEYNFTIAGILAFLGLGFRPEAIFVIIPLCIVIYLSGREGKFRFIILALLFQIIWTAISVYFYGTPFRSIEEADDYTRSINIQGLNLPLRLQGFFIPYYFLFLGLTPFIFFFFIKGVMYFKKNFQTILLVTLLIPVFFPLLVNGLAGAKSTIYHTTHYIYLPYFISPVFAGIWLEKFLNKFQSNLTAYIVSASVIFSSIPFSYIKEFMPDNYRKLFPKVIQFIATTEDPEETRVLLDFIDENIENYPALIFDADDNNSSIFYIPFRTKLPASPAKDQKVLITSYNVPSEKENLKTEIKKFMAQNPSGLIMVKKADTVLNTIITELTSVKYTRNNFIKTKETAKWVIYTYRLNN
ncbi:MAG: glycosyltransferase family 39 protein [Ignavibacteria bacterium]|nr:glycosyltransferase family 39 protein [Ignavibacteria bacterium]